MRQLFHFEHRRQPLAHPRIFVRRLARNVLLALGVVVVALAIGMTGYIGFEGMSFIDAFVNAAMILSGMGPLTQLTTAGGKVFAGIYALMSGLLIFAIAGVALAPLFHRMMHRFHLEDEDDEQKKKKPR